MLPRDGGLADAAARMARTESLPSVSIMLERVMRVNVPIGMIDRQKHGNMR